MGDYSALADGVDCYTMVEINIGSYVIINQRVFICTGNHDVAKSIPLVTVSVRIDDYAWVCAEVFIEEGAVVGVRSVFTKNVGSYEVVAGNPEKFIKQRVLESRGCQVEFSNYHPGYIEKKGGESFRNPVSKANLKIGCLIFSDFINRVFSSREYLEGMDFREDTLGVSGWSYKEGEDLSDVFSKFDLLICGNDQVWNPPVQYGVDSVCFLSSNRKVSARKISYAPGFGSDSLHPKYHEHVKGFLPQLDALSVREESGVQIVQDLSGQVPVVVRDPTTLSGDFESIRKSLKFNGKVEKYCFLYNLRTNDGVKESSKFMHDSGLEVLEVHNPHRRWRSSGRIVYPTLEQWLYLHNHSDFVLTNSFHGVTLSIVNKKPFAYLPLEGVKSKMNAQTFNLLRLCGLEDHIVNSRNSIADVFNSDIDWLSVSLKQNFLRDAGRKFLDQQICLSRGGDDRI